MKFLTYAGSFALALLLIFFTNNAFAQGQGNGKGKGLVENRGVQNGEGFTTGQGHLNGNSAIDLNHPCLAPTIDLFLAFEIYYDLIILDSETFSIKWNVLRGDGVVFCIISVVTVSDVGGGCSYTDFRELFPCPLPPDEDF